VPDYTYFCYDIGCLEKKIVQHLPKIITKNKQTENLTPDLLVSLTDAIVSMSTSTLSQINGKISTIILKRITEQTQNELQNIVTIPRAYRLTGKGVANKPMAYVNNLQNPILSFYSSYSDYLDKEKWQEVWLQEILTNLIEKYIEMANQLLTSERQKDAIISKVNKTQKSHAGTGGVVAPGAAASTAPTVLSDTDKMTLQLILDIQHFSSQLLRNFNINSDIYPPFQKLWSLVSDSQHLLSTLHEHKDGSDKKPDLFL